MLAPTYVAAGPGGEATVRFGNVNVQIVSGAGTTTATPNGLGNLIVGYDEAGGQKTGSHNLILGRGQTYTSYGSLVAGLNNSATGPNTAVLGADNKASTGGSTVTGGRNNSASGANSSISGGRYNQSSAQFSSVTGGCGNVAGNLHAAASSCGNSGAPSVTGGLAGGRRVQHRL